MLNPETPEKNLSYWLYRLLIPVWILAAVVVLIIVYVETKTILSYVSHMYALLYKIKVNCRSYNNICPQT